MPTHHCKRLYRNINVIKYVTHNRLLMEESYVTYERGLYWYYNELIYMYMYVYKQHFRLNMLLKHNSLNVKNNN